MVTFSGPEGGQRMLLWLLLMMLMMLVTMMMARVLQGHVGGDHLAAGAGSAIVEGVIRHAVLCPTSGLAETREYDDQILSVSCLYSFVE